MMWKQDLRFADFSLKRLQRTSLLTLILGACSSYPIQHHDPELSPEKLNPKAAAEKSGQVHAELIRQMIDKGQFYAALAHIQDAKLKNGNDDELVLLEAECRRRIGQTAEAEALYRRLLNTSLAGEAYHGLGLLYVKTNLSFAVSSLRQAAEKDPTNAAIRNDLGRALMESGRYTEAMPELSTSAELAPDQVKSRNNLIVLMMLIGDEPAVSRLAQESGTSPEELQGLRDQAQGIRAMQATRPAMKTG